MILPAEQRAIKSAQATLKKYYISDPSLVNIEDIIGHENILLKKVSMHSCQGNLIRGKNFAVINLNSSIENPNKIRFILSHELGHWFMHKDKMTFACTSDDFKEFSKNPKQIEQEANTYAGELLIPSNLIREQFKKDNVVDLDFFKEMSTRFKVSLTAFTLKFAFLAIKPICIVFSRNGLIEWSCPSQNFPFGFFGKSNIPQNSLTAKYFKGSVRATTDGITTKSWFNIDSKVKNDSYLTEMIAPMPNINCCLTYLIPFEENL